MRSQFPNLIVPDLESQIESVRQSITAKLDEQHRQPELTIKFADLKNQEVLDEKIALLSKVVKLPQQNEFPDYRTGILALGENVDYYRDIAEYIKQTSLIEELGFAIINLSDKAARDITIEITIAKISGLIIQSNSDYPPFPKASIIGAGIDLSRFSLANDNTISIRDLKNKWIITADFKKVRPTETIFSEIPFLVSSTIPQTLELEPLFAPRICQHRLKFHWKSKYKL